MHAQPPAPGAPAGQRRDQSWRARGKAEIRGRRGYLHRRSCLHASVRLSVAVGEEARRSAARRSSRPYRPELRRLRQLRRGGRRGGAVPLLLPRRRDPQSACLGPVSRPYATAGHRLASAAARGEAPDIRRCLTACRPPLSESAPQMSEVIKIATLAVGGQGGGVLCDWIVEVAEANGYVAQSTSVAGVAQRTGATIYYIEMAPDTGRLPIFALSPSQGDVDILIAAELMEAGPCHHARLCHARPHDADRFVASNRGSHRRRSSRVTVGCGPTRSGKRLPARRNVSSPSTWSGSPPTADR